MKREKGWVYFGVLGREALASLVEQLPERVVLSWDLSRLDFPDTLELRDAGCAFNSVQEIRWEKVAEERYRVWVLSDREQGDLPEPLKPVDGEWEVEKIRTRLIDPENKRFAPQFRHYPGKVPEAGWSGRIFYRNRVATFVSFREETSHATESQR